MLGVERRQAVFIDQHGLMREPLRLRRFADMLEHALAQFAWPWNEIQAFRFRFRFFAEYHSAHFKSCSNFLIGAGMPIAAN